MDCIFCKIVAREIPAYIIFENDHVISFLDLHPNSQGHALLIPKKHFDTTLETAPDELASMISAVPNIARALMEAAGATGFNLIANNGADAGQVIMHTHWHIIPRHAGDGLRPWPSTTAQPEQLTQLAEKIRELI